EREGGAAYESLAQLELRQVQIAALELRVAAVAVETGIEERAQLRGRRRPESGDVGSRETRQLPVQPPDLPNRVREQRAVRDEDARQPAGRGERRAVVELPERDPVEERQSVARRERAGDRQRLAGDEHADGPFEDPAPERKEEAEAGIFDHPRPGAELARDGARSCLRSRPCRLVEEVDDLSGPAPAGAQAREDRLVERP